MWSGHGLLRDIPSLHVATNTEEANWEVHKPSFLREKQVTKEKASFELSPLSSGLTFGAYGGRVYPDNVIPYAPDPL